jgi:hypothetical protein
MPSDILTPAAHVPLTTACIAQWITWATTSTAGYGDLNSTTHCGRCVLLVVAVPSFAAALE